MVGCQEADGGGGTIIAKRLNLHIHPPLAPEYASLPLHYTPSLWMILTCGLPPTPQTALDAAIYARLKCLAFARRLQYLLTYSHLWNL